MLIPMTMFGFEQLKSELHLLKTTTRKEVIEAIRHARSYGDLSENAEYHAAKEKQGFVEARIKEIEARLSHAEVIDIAQMANDGKVIFGSTVELYNLNDESKFTYTIVGEDEADLKQNKISYKSPLARALIGKFEGDEVHVHTPSGAMQYEIESVIYSVPVFNNAQDA